MKIFFSVGQRRRAGGCAEGRPNTDAPRGKTVEDKKRENENQTRLFF